MGCYNDNMRRYKSFPTHMPVIEVDPIPLTAAFFAELKTKQAKLAQEKKELLVRLKDAREMGDLSENGAYKYAKIELGSVGKQLQQLAFLLQHGYVAEIFKSDVVGFGSTVTLESDDKTVEYRILSEYEADVAKGSISLKSPLGSLLIGKKIGETVTLDLGKKKLHYLVKNVLVLG